MPYVPPPTQRSPLTSMTDFQQNSPDELASAGIKALEETAVAPGQWPLAIWDLEESDRDTVLSSYVGPPDVLFVRCLSP